MTSYSHFEEFHGDGNDDDDDDDDDVAFSENIPQGFDTLSDSMAPDPLHSWLQQ